MPQCRGLATKRRGKRTYAYNQPLQLADPSGLKALNPHQGEPWTIAAGTPIIPPATIINAMGGASAFKTDSFPAEPPSDFEAAKSAGGPFTETLQDALKTVVSEQRLPSGDELLNSLSDHTFDALNKGPLAVFEVGTILKFAADPQNAINIGNGILGIQRAGLCGTINGYEAAALVAIGMAPAGCENAPGVFGPVAPAARARRPTPPSPARSIPTTRSVRVSAQAVSRPRERTCPIAFDFENASTATAPAQQVVVTDQLSSNDDWGTFRITEVGWGDTVIVVPANSQNFQTTVPMTFDGQSFNVLVQVGINLLSGLVTAQFYSIDPTTQLPPGVLVGFLPPEDGTGRGMGYFTYTIMPNPGLPTGTQIRNVADVSFDEQPIIATDQVSETDPTQGTDPSKEALVTIDAGPPASAVAPLPAVTTTTGFTVSWSGSDDAVGSGIAGYNIYVSDNGGPYTLFTSGDSSGSATFTGQNGHTYGFYSIATDDVGNQETAKSVPDTSTTVDAPVTETWSGGGADNNWLTGENWSSLATPDPGDSVAFQGALRTTTNNDLPTGTLLQSITLASPGFQLGGNAVTLASASEPVVTLAATKGTIQLPITLGSNATFAVTNAQGSLTVSGNINNGGYGLTVDTSSSQSSTVSGSISGAGGFIKTGGGNVILSGPNSFSGGVQVLAGTLVVAAAGALPNGTSLTIGAGGIFLFDPSASGASASTPSIATMNVVKPQAAATSGVVASASLSVPIVAGTAASAMAGPISRQNLAAIGEVMSSTSFTRAVPALRPVGPAPAAQRRGNLSQGRTAVETKASHTALTSAVSSSAAAWLWESGFTQTVNDQVNQKKDVLAAVDKLLAMMTR